MRRYDARTKVTPEEAMALVYGWWITLWTENWNPKSYIVDWLHTTKSYTEHWTPKAYIVDWLHKVRSLASHLRNVGDVSEFLVSHWGHASVRLSATWPYLSNVVAECPLGLVHLANLREFLHGTKTRKEAAQKARKKRACGRRVGKAKRP